MLCEVIAET